MDDEEKKIMEEYEEDVRWLRGRVPRDDIYDFAQQALIGAEYFILFMSEKFNLYEEIQQDETLAHWIANFCSITRMKKDNFEGILNVKMRIEKNENYNPRDSSSSS